MFPTRVEALDSEAGKDDFEASIAILVTRLKTREPYDRAGVEVSMLFSFSPLPTTSTTSFEGGVGLDKADSCRRPGGLVRGGSRYRAGHVINGPI